MNDWNPLETQMRGWVPRHPSARLSARLFGGLTGERNGAWLGARNWLAPATVVALLLLVSVGERFQPPGSPPGLVGRRIATALSNQSYATYCVGAANIGFNAPILELPKASRSSSSLGSFQTLKTNSSLY